jgi:hypothetical protein
MIVGSEPEMIDLEIPNYFRVLGEYFDGEQFEKTSNSVNTYYYMTFLPCGCYMVCFCELRDRPPPIREGLY